MRNSTWRVKNSGSEGPRKTGGGQALDLVAFHVALFDDDGFYVDGVGMDWIKTCTSKYQLSRYCTLSTGTRSQDPRKRNKSEKKIKQFKKKEGYRST